MTRYAHIKNSMVVNVVLWDGVTPLEGDPHLEPVDDVAGVSFGWGFTDGVWVEPAPEPEPEEPTDPNLEQKLAAVQKLVDDFGFTEGVARAVVGLPLA